MSEGTKLQKTVEKSKLIKVTENITRELISPGIYRYVSEIAKIGWAKDNRNGKYFCYGIDVMLKVPGLDKHGKQKKRRHRDKPIPSKDAAEKILATLKLRQHERRYSIQLTSNLGITLEQVFDAVIPTIEDEKEKQRALRIKVAFLALLPAYYLVTELSEADTFKYAELRKEEGVADSTARREITTFSSIVHKAPLHFNELQGWQCPKFYRPDDSDTGRERTWSSKERDKLLNYLLNPDKLPNENPRSFLARRRAGLTLYFSLMTSLRHGDVCKVKKAWWDKEANILKVKHSKTTTFTIYKPVPKTIKWILEQAEILLPTSEFFFSSYGKIHNKTYILLRDACDKDHLNLPYGRFKEDGFIIHDLRHTTTTVLGHNKIDVVTTQGITGHKDVNRVKDYTHASSSSRAEAIDVIERELALNIHGNASENEKTKEEFLKELFSKVKNGEITESDFAGYF